MEVDEVPNALYPDASQLEPLVWEILEEPNSEQVREMVRNNRLPRNDDEYNCLLSWCLVNDFPRLLAALADRMEPPEAIFIFGAGETTEMEFNASQILFDRVLRGSNKWHSLDLVDICVSDEFVNRLCDCLKGKQNIVALQFAPVECRDEFAASLIRALGGCAGTLKTLGFKGADLNTLAFEALAKAPTLVGALTGMHLSFPDNFKAASKLASVLAAAIGLEHLVIDFVHGQIGRDVFKAFKHPPKLKTLLLNCGIDASGLQALCNVLPDCGMLDNLCLDNCSLAGIDVAPLGRAVAKLKKLKKVSLLNCKLGSTQLAAFSNALKQGAGPYDLDLSNNICGVDAGVALGQLFASGKLESINLSSCELNDQMLQSLVLRPAPDGRGRPTLERCDLSYNTLSWPTIQRVLSGVAVKHLVLQGIPLTARAESVCFISLLNDQPLISLDLSDCDINNEGMALLAPALGAHPTLTVLVLEANELGVEDFVPLAEALHRNDRAQGLWLLSNVLSEEATGSHILNLNGSLIDCGDSLLLPFPSPGDEIALNAPFDRNLYLISEKFQKDVKKMLASVAYTGFDTMLPGELGSGPLAKALLPVGKGAGWLECIRVLLRLKATANWSNGSRRDRKTGETSADPSAEPPQKRRKT